VLNFRVFDSSLPLIKVPMMGNQPDDPDKIIADLRPDFLVSRRDLLAGGAATIAFAFVPAASLRLAQTAPLKEILTSTERQSLAAMVSRIIPSGADGPGALEAGCEKYIESALADAYQSLRQAYSAGLAALESYAKSTEQKPFASLDEMEQDKILSDFEKNTKVAEFGDSAAFFEMVRRHTLEGMFGDPSYGGNANFAGWELIGYPGPRMYVGPQMQKMDATISPSRVSAKELVHGSR
jgi:gluconate 2-dehydrogenase gamma chain